MYRIKDPNLWHGKAPYGGVILDSSVHNFYISMIAKVRDFVMAMIEDRPPRADPADALKAVEAVTESNEKKRVVILLPTKRP